MDHGIPTLDERFRDLLDEKDDRPLIEANSQWTTLGEVRAIGSAVMAAIHGAGVRDDAAIGLMARNRVPHVAALFHLLAARRSILMLHAYQAPRALSEEIGRMKLAAIIADPLDWTPEAVVAAAEAGTLAIAITADGATVVPGAAHADLDGRHVSPPGTAIEMLTSGTTGAPKRVPIRYAALSDAIADAGLATVQAGTTDLSAPYIQFYPLGNISGLYGLLTCASHGQQIVLLEKFAVDPWVRAVAAYRPTAFLSLPPAALRMVLDANVPKEALASIPVLRCGSAPLDPALQSGFEARYGIPILINYGATEFCGVVANWTLEDHQRHGAAKRGSVGRARPGVGLRVVDPASGAGLPAGETGVLEVQARRLSADWVRTTDLAAIDADGFLFLKGRSDSVIIRGGFKVSPEAVAAELRCHPLVKDAAIVGIPDPRLGEVPVAGVEGFAGGDAPEEAALIAYLRERLAAPMVPLAIRTFDALPRTGSMKIDRAALSKLLQPLGTAA